MGKNHTVHLCFCFLTILVACAPESTPSTQAPAAAVVPLSATATPRPTATEETPLTSTPPAVFDADVTGEGCLSITADEPMQAGAADCGGEAGSTGAPLTAAQARIMGEAILLFRRTGALTGVTEEWRLLPDGKLVGGDGSTRQVTEEEVTQTLDAIEALGFFEMGSEYLQREGCCHQYTYTLAALNGDRFHQVDTLDGANGAPAELSQVLDLVSDFVLGSG